MVNETKHSSKSPWLPTICTIVIAAATVFNVFIFNEMKNGNDLIRQEQNLSLRPYVAVGGLINGFIDAAKPEEKWQINTIFTNQGSLPANKIKIYYWVDGLDSLSIQQPKGLRTFSLAPNTQLYDNMYIITKQEAKNILAQNSEMYMHINIWYECNKMKYFSNYTYQIKYIEGKELSFVIYFSEIN